MIEPFDDNRHRGHKLNMKRFGVRRHRRDSLADTNSAKWCSNGVHDSPMSLRLSLVLPGQRRSADSNSCPLSIALSELTAIFNTLPAAAALLYSRRTMGRMSLDIRRKHDNCKRSSGIR